MTDRGSRFHRQPVTERLVMAAARRLTERDRLLLALLWEHRVLTTEQVAALAFDSLTTARHRLAQLYALRLVDRFQPLRNSRPAPYHYVLDHLGSCVVVADRGGDPDTLDWRKENALAITASQRLAHLVGTNDVLVRLAATARRDSAADLRLWWSEGRFARWLAAQTVAWPDLGPHGRVPRARPDAYAVWHDGATLAFALEYDRGTEPLARLRAKVSGYVELAWLLGAPPWTLFAFGSPRREAHARAALSAAPVPIATASVLTDPAGPVWAPVWTPHAEPDAARLRLASLPLLTDLPPPVRGLLASIAEPGARARRRRLSFDEARGGYAPTPTDPDDREGVRSAFA